MHRRQGYMEYWRHTWAILPDDGADTVRRPVEDAVFAIIYLEEHPTHGSRDDDGQAVGQARARDNEGVGSVPDLSISSIAIAGREEKSADGSRCAGDLSVTSS